LLRDAAVAREQRERVVASTHDVHRGVRKTPDHFANLGRVADGLKTEDLKGDAVAPFIEEVASGFGPLRAVSHSAVLPKTPAFWARPAMPLGSHPAQWPARG